MASPETIGRDVAVTDFWGLVDMAGMKLSGGFGA
jgi:hypothetical protein